MPGTETRDAGNVIELSSLEPQIAMIVVEDVGDTDIARRAFELYCERGSAHGHDLDDWLNAERELRIGAAAALA